MNQEHWTTGDFIEYIYGLRTDASHLASCTECNARLKECRQSRAALESEWKAEDGVSTHLLAAQRRSIYAAIDKPQRWWSISGRPQWASAALVVALLAGGVTLVEERHSGGTSTQVHNVTNALSDSQLADDVSSFADDPEPSAAAPLQQLFED